MLEGTMVLSPEQYAGQRYAKLPPHLGQALATIEPSHDGPMTYHPCRAVIEEPFGLDAVYLVSEGAYFRHWGRFPEDDKGKNWIPIDLIQRIEESPLRLPARFADQIYHWGPTGLGYFAFTVVFADASQQTCVTGNAVDFIHYPPGKGPADVADVIPYEGKRDAWMLRSPKYFWCLYSEEG